MKDSLKFQGIHQEIFEDTTRLIDGEGGLSSGKTTVALWKEITFLDDYPGIWSLMGRWTGDAVDRLLKPAFEQLARIYGLAWTWNDKEKSYECANGSRMFAFGLATQSTDPVQRYGKIRGLPVSRIYIDQAEQLPSDIAGELVLRMRPDIEARMRNVQYPRQLTFTPNPTSDAHWLAKMFPENNSIKGRKYYALSLYDNAHNLPPEMIDDALLAFPPEHPKHQTVILGKRGLNVMGDPVYETIFNRKLHVRECEARPDIGLIEAFQIGEHNPTWIIGQRSYYGGLALLGGVMGRHLLLDTFLPLVRRYRNDWFHDATIRTCSGPKMMTPLREAKFSPIGRANAEAPDVQLEMIEQIGGMLRHRVTGTEEAISINSDPTRWIVVGQDGEAKPTPFLAFAFEGGYVWSPHKVSVGNKELKQPHADDEYANAMRCVEHLVLNFCAGQKTEDQQAEARRKAQGGPSGIASPTSPNAWMGM